MKYRARVFIRLRTSEIISLDVCSNYQHKSPAEWKAFVERHEEISPSGTVAFTYVEVDSDEL